MNSQDEKKARDEIRNVERAMVARLSDLSDADLVAELREDGFDPAEDAAQVASVLERAVGRARMAAARAGLAASRSRRNAAKVVGSPGLLEDAKGTDDGGTARDGAV
ncbi:MAG: hypothetical protein WDN49_25795 [Acetobacteraceae bacterium]